MLHLTAPVSCNIVLADKSTKHIMSLGQWKEILAKLNQANEFRIYGFEAWFQAQKSLSVTEDELFSFFSELDKMGKCFHIYLDSASSYSSFRYDRFFTALLNCSYLGSTIFTFSGKGSLATEPGWSALEEASAAGFDTGASILLTMHSLEEVGDLTDEALDGGASLVIFERVRPSEQEKIDLEAFKRGAAKIYELRQLGTEVSLSGCFPNCFSQGDIPSCLAGTVSCAITPEGTLRPCRYASASGCLDLISCSLSEAWQSPALEKWRLLTSETCQGCAKCNLCPGGCLLYTYESNSAQSDPFITGQIDEETVLQEVTLEDELCPVPCYNVREEDFGWLLMRGSRVIPVSSKAGPVLARFTGKVTLGEIEQEFGAGALSFIYSLCVRGFIELKETI